MSVHQGILQTIERQVSIVQSVMNWLHEIPDDLGVTARAYQGEVMLYPDDIEQCERVMDRLVELGWVEDRTMSGYDWIAFDFKKNGHKLSVAAKPNWYGRGNGNGVRADHRRHPAPV